MLRHLPLLLLLNWLLLLNRLLLLLRALTWGCCPLNNGTQSSSHPAGLPAGTGTPLGQHCHWHMELNTVRHHCRSTSPTGPLG